MLKLLGTLLVFGACATLGTSAWQRLRQRMRALDAMLSAMDYIENEIQSCMTSLPALITALAHANNIIIASVFRSMEQRIAENGSLSLPYQWCRTFQECAEHIGLGAEETQLLCDVSLYLGKYDASQQLIQLHHTRKKLEMLREGALEDVRSRGKIYRTCGFAIGAVMVLVLL